MWKLLWTVCSVSLLGAARAPVPPLELADHALQAYVNLLTDAAPTIRTTFDSDLAYENFFDQHHDESPIDWTQLVHMHAPPTSPAHGLDSGGVASSAEAIPEIHNNGFIKGITFEKDGSQFLLMPTEFIYEPADAKVQETVARWLQKEPSDKIWLEPDGQIVQWLNTRMNKYFHTYRYAQKVYTRREILENYRNYMVTYHKQSQWTAREGRHNILAIWNGEYLGRLGYRLVLRGFVVPGRDWGAYDHPSFVTYDRVPNSFETLYQRRTPEVSEQPAQNPIAHE